MIITQFYKFTKSTELVIQFKIVIFIFEIYLKDSAKTYKMKINLSTCMQIWFTKTIAHILGKLKRT